MYCERNTLSTFYNAVKSMCRDGPFSILYDEGNDADHKYFAILIRLWDERVCMPATRLLDMPICNIAIVQSIFDLIDEALTKRNIPWSNVVGFESDTYSSGQNKVPTAELKSRLIVVQKSFDSRFIVIL